MGLFGRNNEIDAQTAGAEFEITCAEILRQQGFKRIRVTQESRDQGADIIAWKKGYKYAIQCKLYGRPVGNKAVQEVHAAKTYYNCHKAAVMTNQTFTSGAIDLAEMTEVELWGEMPTKVRKRWFSIRKLCIFLILCLFAFLVYKFPEIISKENLPITVAVIVMLGITAIWIKQIFRNRTRIVDEDDVEDEQDEEDNEE